MLSAKRCSPTMARRELKIGLTSEIASGVSKVIATSQRGRLVRSSFLKLFELGAERHRRYASSGTTSQNTPPYCKSKSNNIEIPGFFTQATVSPELAICLNRIGAQRKK